LNREIIETREKMVSDSILRKKSDVKSHLSEKVLGEKVNANTLLVIETEEWNNIVEDCYTQFCTGQACKEAKAQDCSRLHNTLVMLHDFSTVVEAKRSMWDGDFGRLMIIWSKWSLMTQALPGITNYSTYLPQVVLLITVILLPDMRKYLQHNLLITPTGRDDCFLSKDGWLEVQNYWLKHFYNNCGNGTQIDWLCNIYSPNIMMVRNHLSFMLSFGVCYNHLILIFLSHFGQVTKTLEITQDQ
jgi:hypothetical protein